MANTSAPATIADVRRCGEQEFADVRRRGDWKIADLAARIRTSFRQASGPSGTPVDILKSGLQKSIRRGEVEAALWYVVQLDAFLYAPGGAAVRTNFLHRLAIIALEDIGPANLGLLPKVAAALTLLRAPRPSAKTTGNSGDADGADLAADLQGRAPAIAALFDVVARMAQSPHARILSHVRAAFADEALLSCPAVAALRREVSAAAPGQPRVKFELSASEKPLADDVRRLLLAIEARSFAAVYWADRIARSSIRIRRGRRTKPAFTLFAALEAALAGGPLAPICELMRDWYAELANTAEAPLCYTLLIVAVALGVDGGVSDPVVLGVPKGAPRPPCVLGVDGGVPTPVVQGVSFDDPTVGWARGGEANPADDWLATLGRTQEIAPYVIDKHTALGRQQGKTAADFAVEGAVVANEWPRVDPVLRAHYEAVRRGIPYAPPPPEVAPPAPARAVDHSPRRESEVFELRARAQLVCSKSRPDTYFARERATGRAVFVKGPFARCEDADAAARIAELKRAAFAPLPTVELEVRMLVPDLLETAVGIRQRLGQSEPRAFLVGRDLTGGADLPVVSRSSKVWPETAVVDWARVTTCRPCGPEELAKLGPAPLRLYVLGAFWRYILGIPDAADRNFVHVPAEGAVYSVDEDAVGRPISLRATLRPHRADWVRQILPTVADEIRPVLTAWRASLPEVRRLLNGMVAERAEKCLAELETAESIDATLAKV